MNTNPKLVGCVINFLLHRKNEIQPFCSIGLYFRAGTVNVLAVKSSFHIRFIFITRAIIITMNIKLFKK